jgi:hypothetical protein
MSGSSDVGESVRRKALKYCCWHFYFDFTTKKNIKKHVMAYQKVKHMRYIQTKVKKSQKLV